MRPTRSSSRSSVLGIASPKAPTTSSLQDDDVIRARRRFLATVGGAMTVTAPAVLLDAPSVIAQPKVQWRMSTAFTASLDVHQRAAVQLAKIVEETSGGRFKIEVFPAGQIMEP